VQRWQAGSTELTDDRVADEWPIALTYNSIPHVVMLASPADLEELGVGFTLSESLVRSAADITSVEVFDHGESLEVRMSIDAESFSALLRQRRNLTGRTGCGLCGAETVDQAIRHPAPVGDGPSITSDELHAALLELTARQPVNAITGSVHAAAWALPGKGIQLVREDVGRHNALDKVLGALARAGIDARQGYLVITSRASYEMVQKAATMGISVLAAVSAPTALAIRLAEQSGLTLIGFARTQQHVVYANPQRLLR
jgi:FdhD protein